MITYIRRRFHFCCAVCETFVDFCTTFMVFDVRCYTGLMLSVCVCGWVWLCVGVGVDVCVFS